MGARDQMKSETVPGEHRQATDQKRMNVLPKKKEISQMIRYCRFNMYHWY